MTKLQPIARSLALGCTALGIVAACKTDPKPASDESITKPRSAKIDLKPKHQMPASPDSPAPPPPPSLQPDPAAGEQPDAERARRFRRPAIDADGDGVVSAEERASALSERSSNMHRRLDLDKDGKLTSAELAQVPSRLHFDNPDALDTNRDGDISADELAAALQERREARMRARAAAGSGQPGDPGTPGEPPGDPNAPR